MGLDSAGRSVLRASIGPREQERGQSHRAHTARPRQRRMLPQDCQNPRTPRAWQTFALSGFLLFFLACSAGIPLRVEQPDEPRAYHSRHDLGPTLRQRTEREREIEREREPALHHAELCVGVSPCVNVVRGSGVPSTFSSRRPRSPLNHGDMFFVRGLLGAARPSGAGLVKVNACTSSASGRFPRDCSTKFAWLQSPLFLSSMPSTYDPHMHADPSPVSLVPVSRWNWTTSSQSQERAGPRGPLHLTRCSQIHARAHHGRREGAVPVLLCFGSGACLAQPSLPPCAAVRPVRTYAAPAHG